VGEPMKNLLLPHLEPRKTPTQFGSRVVLDEGMRMQV